MLQPWQIKNYDCLSSTMDQAALLLEEMLDPDMRLAIVAREQTKGRGRYQRSWVSQSGNLFLSLLFQPQQPFEKWPQITFVTSLALCNFMRDLLSDQPSITLKWPNDILIDGQKVSGILLEIQQDEKGEPWLVVGIGINIVSAPDHTLYPVTYLQKYKKEIQNNSDLLTELLHNFDTIMMLWQTRGFEEVRRLWRLHAAHLGKEIEINTGNERLHGTFLDLDAEGRVLLETKNGLRLTISAGDVFCI